MITLLWFLDVSPVRRKFGRNDGVRAAGDALYQIGFVDIQFVECYPNCIVKSYSRTYSIDL